MDRDFDDDISDLGGTLRPAKPEAPPARDKSNEEKLAEVLERSAGAPAIFNERCPKCGGSGFWRGIRSRPCFACKGKGTLSFKTAPEQRAKARVRAAEKRIEREHDKEVWRQDHAAEIEWLKRAARRNEERGGNFTFPASLLEKLAEFGTLLDGPLAKVQELMERDRVRAAESQAKRSSAIDATKIEAAFTTARAKAARPGALGIWTKPLKLRARDTDLVFSPGSVGSEFEGMIFVKDAEGTKLGWIKNGQFTRRRECTDEDARAVTQACEDPAQAAVAFGKAWGVCTVCGRRLLEAESIARGIGPICAENYGW